MPDAELMSRPFHPSGEHCCEACVFGIGRHAEFCWPCPNPDCNARVNLRLQMRESKSTARCEKCGIVLTTVHSVQGVTAWMVEIPNRAG